MEAEDTQDQQKNNNFKTLNPKPLNHPKPLTLSRKPVCDRADGNGCLKEKVLESKVRLRQLTVLNLTGNKFSGQLGAPWPMVLSFSAPVGFGA